MIECPYYADRILKALENHFGRIGTYCNTCEIKECSHNGVHMEESGFNKQFGLLEGI